MTRLTAKSSTIFIASGGKTRVYQSLSDVPPVLRRKLEESTKGSCSATILIADRRGREELVRAFQSNARRQQASLQPKRMAAPRRWRRRVHFRNALAPLIPVLLGILIWIFMANCF